MRSAPNLKKVSARHLQVTRKRGEREREIGKNRKKEREIEANGLLL